MYIILVTLGINAACVFIGFILSVIRLYTNKLDGLEVHSKKEKTKVLWERLPLILFNVAILQILAAVGLYFGQGMLDQSGFYWGIFIAQFFIFLFADDFYFYWFHRLMHENEYLFQKIHRIHHKASQPFAIEFIYVHPFEWMGGSLGVLLGFLLIYFSFGSVNVYAFWFYAFYRSVHEVEIHSGLEFRIFSWLPFYGSVKHHDDHHAYVRGNYASSLTYLDKIFKTGFKA
jgi:sterol desaturase/sphingolipid hydroxylase (fatty acid hydroxylase superfamily)